MAVTSGGLHRFTHISNMFKSRLRAAQPIQNPCVCVGDVK
jgi:hypothetical protein